MITRTEGERFLVNVGCGMPESSRLPRHFDGWRHLRVDVDPKVQPDLIADLTDLSGIANESADAVWASHCVEHLFDHQVKIALREFRRILRDDGFVCIVVPDLQSVAEYVAADRLHEPIYQSAAGPVTAHDILFGFGPAIARGDTSMAHHCGFTPGAMHRHFQGVPFGEVMLRRRPQSLELVALARAIPPRDDAERNLLISALGL